MNSIEFGGKFVSGGNGIDSSRFREIQESTREISGGSESGATGDAKTFGEFLQNLATEANNAQIVADRKMNDVATGREKDLHGAVLAMEKSDVQFRLLTQVRNKVIEAYREIMRMQV